MTEIATPVSPLRSRVISRLLGAIVAIMAVAAAVLWGLGAVNPWRLVVLTTYFGQPGVGLLVVGVLAVLSARLLVPVVSEARHQWRARVQVSGVIMAVVGLLLWGLMGSLFTPDRTVLARSPQDDRAVVLVVRGSADQELRIWAGKGFDERDMGRLGPACGQVTARFLERDLVEIESSYGTFQLHLDPTTGAPREDIGEHCSGER